MAFPSGFIAHQTLMQRVCPYINPERYSSKGSTNMLMEKNIRVEVLPMNFRRNKQFALLWIQNI